MTGNNIQNNAQYGLNVPFSTGITHQAHGNAFKGNALFAIYTPSDSVGASSNWWGVNGQQPGVGGADAVSGRTGDLTPLAAAPSVPPLAPKVPLTSAMPRPAAPRTVEQRHTAGRAALDRFASARAVRARWYLSKLDAMRRAAR